jgi:hypothetical protein
MSQSFGRRALNQPSKAPLPAMSKFARPAAPAPEPTGPGAASVDDELRQWKSARGSRFPIRTLALVASVSFGIASVALPKEINEAVQYPLYGLSLASLYVGLRRKRQRR